MAGTCDEMNRDGESVSPAQYDVSYDDAKRSIERAVHMLIKKDIYLLEHDLHERTITHYLAIYLAEQFPEWNVDFEYNRDCNKDEGLKNVVKTIEKLVADNYEDHAVYADIVVHHRGPARNYGPVETRGWIRVVIYEDTRQITVVTAHPLRHYP